MGEKYYVHSKLSDMEILVPTVSEFKNHYQPSWNK